MQSVSNAFPVLVVDDDPHLRRLAQELLVAEQCEVTTAESGAAGVAAFLKKPATLVLLDMTLPDMEGLEVCRLIRALPAGEQAFILILSGRRELADKVAGFHAGADDYVTKPLDTYELSLRVRAIRRRTRSSARPPTDLLVGRWTLQPSTRTLSHDGRLTTLTPVEFQLLHFLMTHPETLFASEMLLREVWHYPPGAGSTDLVRFHIRNLRKKLETDPERPAYLVSVPHHGYMLKTP